MSKCFNTEGSCNSSENYMVKLDGRLQEVKTLVDRGKYFSITRARQYGKTTLLHALAAYLHRDYTVIGLDFQMLSHSDFSSEASFVEAFARELLAVMSDDAMIPEETLAELRKFSAGEARSPKLAILFSCLSTWCSCARKPLILIIDEVDSATNNQVFFDFLSLLRGYYLQRTKRPTFWSVILAGMHDIKNLKLKIRSDEDHRANSPWNIAADFTVNLSFSPADIAGMLEEYERDHRTGMDIPFTAQFIYDYTSGYPFLVSRLCQITDEYLQKNTAWTRESLLDAVKILLAEKNTLFESLIQKLEEHADLNQMLYSILFCGQNIAYNPDNQAIGTAVLFGFIKNANGTAVIANRIFETRLYNYYLTANEVQGSALYKSAQQDKSHFIQHGHLDMEHILERFVVHFHDLYGDCTEPFLEDDARRYFLLYLRPIINGTGNYYVESQTRDLRRTDVIVDYLGDQFIVEMKIWHGQEYHTRGEKQLSEYLDYYHLSKGYLLSFNFNKNKQTGMKRIQIGEKILIEAVV